MQKKYSSILIKFLSQFIIVLGIGMSASNQANDYINSDQGIIAFQNEELNLENFHFLANDNSHIPFRNSPAEESSSEEENEETNDSEHDGELSHYQVASLLNPLTNSLAFADTSISYGSINIPLYVLFHCWKSFIS